METFEIEDLDYNQEEINQAKINQLHKEILQLRAKLNVPPAIKKAIG